MLLSCIRLEIHSFENRNESTFASHVVLVISLASAFPLTIDRVLILIQSSCGPFALYVCLSTRSCDNAFSQHFFRSLDSVDPVVAASQLKPAEVASLS